MKVTVFVCDNCHKVKSRTERKVWLNFEICLGCAAGLKTAGDAEHPTYQDDPTPDETVSVEPLPFFQELNPQGAAMKQATDLALKGWAAVTGTSEGKGIWMVQEGTMRDWRGLLSTAKKQLAGIIREHLTLGADLRVGDALAKLDVLLVEMPQEGAI